MTIEIKLILVTIAVVLAIAVSALIMMKDRRIRNNVRRAQLGARIAAFEVIAFEVGKVAGYEEQSAELVRLDEHRHISNEQKRAMRSAYEEAKLDLIDWVQETFKIDRGSS